MTVHHPDHEVELFRAGEAYEVYVHLPDSVADDVDVRWHDGRLHVSVAERDGATPVYDRHLSLPHSIDADRATASFRDGVLSVRLPIADGQQNRGTPIEVTR